MTTDSGMQAPNRTVLLMPRGRMVPGYLPGTLTWKTDHAAEARDRDRYRGEDELRKLAATRGDAFKEVWVALAMIGVHYCGLQPWRLPNAEVLAAMPTNGDQEG